MPLHSTKKRTTCVLLLSIIVLLVICVIAPGNAHASTYNQYVTINNISVTKVWSEDTDPEPVDVTMYYSGPMKLFHDASAGTDFTFPDSISIYYGGELCGSAQMSGSSSGQSGNSQEYTYTIGIPMHFSSYTVDDSTGLLSQTIELTSAPDDTSNTFSFAFDDILIKEDNPRFYYDDGFYVLEYSLFNLDAMENSTFGESADNGAQYDYSVSKSRSSETQSSQNVSGWTVVTTNTLEFTITNTAIPEGTLQVNAQKTVNYRTPDQSYTFCLLDSDGNVLQTKQNDEDGSIRFDPILYDSDDIGVEHTYQVEEQAGSDESVTYDSSVYTVTVTPYQDPDDDSSIIVNPVITKGGEEVSAITFNNTIETSSDISVYDISVTAAWDDEADPESMDVAMSYSGSMLLRYSSSGNDSIYPDTLQIYYGDELCGTAVKLDSDSDQLSDTREYVYHISVPFHFSSYDPETRSQTLELSEGAFSVSFGGISLTSGNYYSQGGYFVGFQDLLNLDAMESSTFSEETSSGTEYDFTVSAARSDTVEALGGGETRFTHTLDFTITNSKKPSGTLELTARKTVNNGLPDKSYTFYLLDSDGNILQTKQNDSDGTIKFDAITYGTADIGREYTYQVVEQEGADENVTYDRSVYTVTVTPYQDPDSSSVITASPTVTKDGEAASSITFNNTVEIDNGTPRTGDTAEPRILAAAIAAAALGLLGLRKRNSGVRGR
ncbi:MAG: Spy0128 family protein [Oscillospiraceae bacterium]|jgi:pilin isopeptide linkage protein